MDFTQLYIAAAILSLVALVLWTAFFKKKNSPKTAEESAVGNDMDPVTKQKMINALLKVGQISQVDAIALRKNRAPSDEARRKFNNAYRHSQYASDNGFDDDLLFLFAAYWAMEMILPENPTEDFFASDSAYSDAFESEAPADFGLTFGVEAAPVESVVFEQAVGSDFTPTESCSSPAACDDDLETTRTTFDTPAPSYESSDSYSSSDSYGGGCDSGFDD